MSEQISFLPLGDEDVKELERQAEQLYEYAKKKRNWENRFQKWSDEHGMQEYCTESWGACGYGSMCDWCTDNSYGRPCVRALNAMLREKHLQIDYIENFAEVWSGSCAWTHKE